MAAKTAPGVGEAYLENAMRVAYVTFGDSAAADVPLTNAIADSDTVVVTPVFNWGAGGITIFGISSRVVTAFKAGCSIAVGTDSDASVSAAAYWLTTDKVAATAAEGHRPNSSWIDLDSGGSATLTNGIAPMYYSGSGALEVTYTPADSDELATGVLEIGVWYVYGV
jgi:hypothetical protein